MSGRLDSVVRGNNIYESSKPNYAIFYLDMSIWILFQRKYAAKTDKCNNCYQKARS